MLETKRDQKTGLAYVTLETAVEHIKRGKRDGLQLGFLFGVAVAMLAYFASIPFDTRVSRRALLEQVAEKVKAKDEVARLQWENSQLKLPPGERVWGYSRDIIKKGIENE